MTTESGPGFSPSQQRRQARKAQAQAQQRRRLLWQIGLVMAAAVILVGGFVVYSQLAGQNDARASIDYANLPADGLTLGASDAPVTLVEYGDYRCIHCADFTVDNMPDLVRDFIADGTLRYEFRPTPILGGVPIDDPTNVSVVAAESAMCAADQGAFWPYHDQLMADTQGGTALSEDAYRAAATKVGLDPDALMTCVSARIHLPAVTDSYNAATAQGISSTPTFFLQGAPITWTGDYAMLKRQIESARDLQRP